MVVLSPEKVVGKYELGKPVELMDPKIALMKLCNSKNEDDIGKNGPPMAALKDPFSINPNLNRFNALFGRDSLVISRDLLKIYPEVARSTIFFLAQLQGIEFNEKREEEIGKIIHEYRLRNDPIRKELEKNGWGFPYYGSIDSTPSYLNLIYDYYKNVDENILNCEVISKLNNKKFTIRDSYFSALKWIVTKIKKNDENFLEFKKMNPKGIANQVWRDSWDSYFHKDGSIVDHKNSIASIEVQALVYDVLMNTANYYEKFGENENCISMRLYAKKLHDSIMKKMWMDDKGYFILGTERNKENGELKQIDIKTSNMGHVLDSRLPLEKGVVNKLVDTLFSDEMKSDCGIRTLGRNEKKYNAGSYHNGSIWPMDNYKIAKGLRKRGFFNEAREVEDCILHAVEKLNCYPEFIRGDSDEPRVDKKGREKVIERLPQNYQGWTISAYLAIVNDRNLLKK